MSDSATLFATRAGASICGPKFRGARRRASCHGGLFQGNRDGLPKRIGWAAHSSPVRIRLTFLNASHILTAMPTLALSDLIGAPVIDNTGARAGKVREVTLLPQENSSQIAGFVVKTPQGDRLLPTTSLSLVNGGLRIATPASEWGPYSGGEGMLLLERDLLDQQIIDVHGRKVVRVNDIEIHEEFGHEHIVLKVGAVDGGARGAVRRLVKRVVPAAVLNLLLAKIPPRMIPWEFVDLIEIAPARRVKLKISLDPLAKLHPADIADIVEN